MKFLLHAIKNIKIFRIIQNYIYMLYIKSHRSQSPRGLRRESAAVRWLGLRVRILPWARMSVSCECCVLLRRGPCDALIARPEESYRVWWVWEWSWSLESEEILAHLGLLFLWEKKVFNDVFRIYYNSEAYDVIQIFCKNVKTNEFTLW